MRTCAAIIGLAIAAIAVAVIIAFVRPNSSSPLPGEEAPTTEAPKQPAKMMTFDEVKPGAVRVTIAVDKRGSIVVELYPKAAPKTVAHFLALAKQHFYDGVLVHRLETGTFRVWQSGDPASKGMDPALLAGKTTQQIGEQLHLGAGGSGEMVPLEAHLPNAANTLALARSEQEDSGDSQFYINLNNNNSLDGQYCVFGRIVEGQDVAARVQLGDKITKISAK